MHVITRMSTASIREETHIIRHTSKVPPQAFIYSSHWSRRLIMAGPKHLRCIFSCWKSVAQLREERYKQRSNLQE